MISGIYCIENETNGRAYIGQSSDIKKRWTQHKSDLRAGRHDNKHLQRAWDKYGEDCFLFSIVEECPVEMLDDAEILWIEYFEAYSHGYNMTTGGDATRGLQAWNKGKHRSQRMRQILSECAKKRTGEKNPFFGKHHNEKTRSILSDRRSQPVVEVESGTIYFSAKFADMMFGGKSSNVSKTLNNNKSRISYGKEWERLQQ